MKQRSQSKDITQALIELAKTLAELDDATLIKAFLRDLCTPAELEALTDRWRVVPLLEKGIPYRLIHELTGVSVTTIGRVARTLETGAGGYAAAIHRQSIRETSAQGTSVQATSSSENKQ